MTVPLALPQLSRPLSVVVASKNGVKINAVAAAVRVAFPGLEHSVRGADSDPGVPDQPFGDEQTLLGAYNRLACLAAEPAHAGSLLCAIEGGVGWAAPAPHGWGAPQQRKAGGEQQQQPQLQQGAQRGAQEDGQQQQQQRQLECFAWAVVQAPGGRCSHARSASFLLPPAIAELMLTEGLELGAADDRLWGRVKSGQGSGTIGHLTGGLLTRQAYYQHAVACALVPLMQPAWYPEHAGEMLDAAAGAEAAPPLAGGSEEGTTGP
ncbi:hypothetical protein ABPG75_004421 [Micractinium tetrahymenae]